MYRLQCRRWVLRGFSSLNPEWSQWNVLLGCPMATNVTCYQTCCRWQFCLSARQCIGHLTQSNCCSVKLLFLQSYGHPTTRTWTWLRTRFGESYSRLSVRHGSTNANELKQRLEWSAAEHWWHCRQWVEKVSAGVFAQREEILNIYRRQFWQLKEIVNRHFMDSVFKMF